METNECKQATPHAALIERLMDCNQPKSELEWAARREVLSLRKKLREIVAETKKQEEIAFAYRKHHRPRTPAELYYKGKQGAFQHIENWMEEMKGGE